MNSVTLYVGIPVGAVALAVVAWQVWVRNRRGGGTVGDEHVPIEGSDETPPTK